ncbi:MAG: hypothetical protein RDV48_25835 [Candidatus Eremiobacteraeota bacterium]|nr:hypothetical protein [Candidatus Eremiobacteraeota bacterium]
MKGTGAHAAIMLIFLLASLSPWAWGAGEELYGRDAWTTLKLRVIPSIIVCIQDSFTTKSNLQKYYYKKYPRCEMDAAEKSVAAILPHLDEDQHDQAVKEVMAFHHVVYHGTEWHRMDQNVKVARTYESMVERYALLHHVPPEVAKAVICWENSGDISKISYAECGGLGQLSWGAVERAHKHGKKMAAALREKAKASKVLYEQTGSEEHLREARRLNSEADFYHFEKKHKVLAKKYGISDERLVPECNAEDTVVFLRVLLDYFQDRRDFAIAAYHNGVANMDELTVDYLKRRVPWTWNSEKPDRSFLLQALEKYRITYLTLWDDTRCREMLSGFRTMDGDITTGANSSEALGDESDIYLWKVLAAYGALISSDDSLTRLIDRYRYRWDIAECMGLRVYDSDGIIEEAIKKGELVRLPPVFHDGGISTIETPSRDYEQFFKGSNYYVTPELAGFLCRLSHELAEATGKKQVRIPVTAALESRQVYLAPAGAPGESVKYRTHLQGVAFDCKPSLSSHREMLRLLLKRWYLRDRLYLIVEGDHYHVCLNPRYGTEFYQYYCEYTSKPAAR